MSESGSPVLGLFRRLSQIGRKKKSQKEDDGGQKGTTPASKPATAPRLAPMGSQSGSDAWSQASYRSSVAGGSPQSASSQSRQTQVSSRQASPNPKNRSPGSATSAIRTSRPSPSRKSIPVPSSCRGSTTSYRSSAKYLQEEGPAAGSPLLYHEPSRSSSSHGLVRESAYGYATNETQKELSAQIMFCRGHMSRLKPQVKRAKQYTSKNKEPLASFPVLGPCSEKEKLKLLEKQYRRYREEQTVALAKYETQFGEYVQPCKPMNYIGNADVRVERFVDTALMAELDQKWQEQQVEKERAKVELEARLSARRARIPASSPSRTGRERNKGHDRHDRRGKRAPPEQAARPDAERRREPTSTPAEQPKPRPRVSESERAPSGQHSRNPPQRPIPNEGSEPRRSAPVVEPGTPRPAPRGEPVDPLTPVQRFSQNRHSRQRSSSRDSRHRSSSRDAGRGSSHSPARSTRRDPPAEPARSRAARETAHVPTSQGPGYSVSSRDHRPRQHTQAVEQDRPGRDTRRRSPPRQAEEHDPVDSYPQWSSEEGDSGQRPVLLGTPPRTASTEAVWNGDEGPYLESTRPQPRELKPEPEDGPRHRRTRGSGSVSTSIVPRTASTEAVQRGSNPLPLEEDAPIQARQPEYQPLVSHSLSRSRASSPPGIIRGNISLMLGRDRRELPSEGPAPSKTSSTEAVRGKGKKRGSSDEETEESWRAAPQAPPPATKGALRDEWLDNLAENLEGQLHTEGYMQMGSGACLAPVSALADTAGTGAAKSMQYPEAQLNRMKLAPETSFVTRSHGSRSRLSRGSPSTLSQSSGGNSTGSMITQRGRGPGSTPGSASVGRTPPVHLLADLYQREDESAAQARAQDQAPYSPAVSQRAAERSRASRPSTESRGGESSRQAVDRRDGHASQQSRRSHAR